MSRPSGRSEFVNHRPSWIDHRPASSTTTIDSFRYRLFIHQTVSVEATALIQHHENTLLCHRESPLGPGSLAGLVPPKLSLRRLRKSHALSLISRGWTRLRLTFPPRRPQSASDQTVCRCTSETPPTNPLSYREPSAQPQTRLPLSIRRASHKATAAF